MRGAVVFNRRQRSSYQLSDSESRKQVVYSRNSPGSGSRNWESSILCCTRIATNDLRLKCFKKRRADEWIISSLEALRLLLVKYVLFIYIADESFWVVFQLTECMRIGWRDARKSIRQLLNVCCFADRIVLKSPCKAVLKPECLELFFVGPGVKVDGQLLLEFDVEISTTASLAWNRRTHIRTVWVKKSPPTVCGFLWHFSQTLENFKSIFTHLLYVPIYARLQIFLFNYLQI